MRKLTIGIALVIIGIMIMAYTGFNLITNEKIVNVASIKVIKERSHPVQWSPVVGLVLFVGGILIFAQAKKNPY